MKRWSWNSAKTPFDRALLAAALACALAAPAAADDAPAPAPADSAGASAPADSALTATEAAAAAYNERPHVALRKVKTVRGNRNVVRSGPGDRYAIAGVYPKDAEFTVIAKSDDWYGIELSDTETGWIHASLVKEFDDLSDLQFKPNPRLYTRTGSFVVSGYGGAYAFDRKSNSLVVGGRLGYYVFDRLQAEAGLAWTRVLRPAEIVESLFGLTLEQERFEMLSYHLNATFELLPGRQMVPYVTVGVGSTLMQGDTEPSFNYGAGTELFLSKRVAMRWEFRDFRFKSGPDAARVDNNNVEFTLGTTYLF